MHHSRSCCRNCFLPAPKQHFPESCLRGHPIAHKPALCLFKAFAQKSQHVWRHLRQFPSLSDQRRNQSKHTGRRDCQRSPQRNSGRSGRRHMFLQSASSRKHRQGHHHPQKQLNAGLPYQCAHPPQKHRACSQQQEAPPFSPHAPVPFRLQYKLSGPQPVLQPGQNAYHMRAILTSLSICRCACFFSF